MVTLWSAVTVVILAPTITVALIAAAVGACAGASVMAAFSASDGPNTEEKKK